VIYRETCAPSPEFKLRLNSTSPRKRGEVTRVRVALLRATDHAAKCFSRCTSNGRRSARPVRSRSRRRRRTSCRRPACGEVGINPGLDLLRREVLEVGELVERVPARLAGVDGAAEEPGQALDLRDDLVIRSGFRWAACSNCVNMFATVLKLPRNRPRRARSVSAGPARRAPPFSCRSRTSSCSTD